VSDSSPPSQREAVAELVVNVAFPSVVLLWLSSDDRLGPLWALLLALTPPLLWGIGSMIKAGRPSGVAVIAFASVLLTGGVGLFELDPSWIAIKEGLVPTLFGVATLLSAPTSYAVIPTLMARLFDADAIDAALPSDAARAAWEAANRRATVLVGVLFLVSAIGSWALARFVVVSDAGTEDFNNELGWMTMLSVPALMIPMTLGMAWVLSRVITQLEQLTGRDYEDFLLGQADDGSAGGDGA